jgi:peptidoglycan/LPS O-acetylase OafA/YrhL
MRPSLANLQALRGAACLLVVLYHVGGWELLTWPRVHWLYPLRWAGFAGVDLFFALSGFILTWAHADAVGRPGRLPGYLLRRAWRIGPPFWAAMLLGIGLTTLAGGEVPAVGWAAWLLLPGEPNPLVPVAWSLGYELVFYLAFGGLLLLPRRTAVAAGGGWAAAVIAGGVTGSSPTGRWEAVALGPFVLEFLGGAAAAVLVRGGMVGRPRSWLLLAGAWAAGGLLVAGGPGPDDLPAAVWRRVLVFGPPAVLAVYALAAGDRTGTLALSRRLRPLGDASYSIYLLHVPIGSVVFDLTLGMHHRQVPHLLWLAGMIGAGVGGGWLMYRLVERPLLGLAKRRVPPPVVVGPVSVNLGPPPAARRSGTPRPSARSGCSAG